LDFGLGDFAKFPVFFFTHNIFKRAGNTSEAAFNSFGLVWTKVFLYTEVNNVDGFQAGEDTVVTTASLLDVGIQSDYTVTSSKSTDPTTNVTTATFQLCRTGNTMCIIATLSDADRVAGGATHPKDVLKLEITNSLSIFSIPPGTNLTSTFFSSELLFLFNHEMVDNSAANSAKQISGVQAQVQDLVLTESTNQSAFFTFEREVTAVKSNNGGTTTAPVVVQTTTFDNSLLTNLGINGFTKVGRAGVSYITPISGLDSFDYDPSSGAEVVIFDEGTAASVVVSFIALLFVFLFA